MVYIFYHFMINQYLLYVTMKNDFLPFQKELPHSSFLVATFLLAV